MVRRRYGKGSITYDKSLPALLLARQKKTGKKLLFSFLPVFLLFVTYYILLVIVLPCPIVDWTVTIYLLSVTVNAKFYINPCRCDILMSQNILQAE